MQQTHTTHPPTKSNRYHTERQCRQYCDSNSNDKFDKLVHTPQRVYAYDHSFVLMESNKKNKREEKKKKKSTTALNLV